MKKERLFFPVSKNICDSPLNPPDILVPQDKKKRKSEMIIFYDFTIINAYRLHCVGIENIKKNFFLMKRAYEINKSQSCILICLKQEV
jgi:hypothetical protein